MKSSSLWAKKFPLSPHCPSLYCSPSSNSIAWSGQSRRSQNSASRVSFPFIARRTEKHLAQAADKRAERWRRIAQEAAKQSRRADIPVIAEPISLAARLAQPSSAIQILLAESERNILLRQRIETASLHPKLPTCQTSN
jgi:hypothetical protein